MSHLAIPSPCTACTSCRRSSRRRLPAHLATPSGAKTNTQELQSLGVFETRRDGRDAMLVSPQPYGLGRKSYCGNTGAVPWQQAKCYAYSRYTCHSISRKHFAVNMALRRASEILRACRSYQVDRQAVNQTLRRTKILRWTGFYSMISRTSVSLDTKSTRDSPC